MKKVHYNGNNYSLETTTDYVEVHQANTNYMMLTAIYMKPSNNNGSLLVSKSRI